MKYLPSFKIITKHFPWDIRAVLLIHQINTPYSTHIHTHTHTHNRTKRCSNVQSCTEAKIHTMKDLGESVREMVSVREREKQAGRNTHTVAQTNTH